ncbi:hypothetical protein KC367_g4365 [Hortaea werneckii]|nr:hypothetical protein KC342_g14166 [Hortaea werneckii]KAI7067920.1 hypothetical protein KC339_g15194 [Hortaea werneckii]KAI7222088.1 hypothetical protein KC365_g11488 [Hortaea werneckii]KAI7299244.1 hypothetical protein KC340_g13885 [Hortaea werneckii]KAI7350153.1 hypothetical protein KC354_g12964 [Hortaea werneckii]
MIGLKVSRIGFTLAFWSITAVGLPGIQPDSVPKLVPEDEVPPPPTGDEGLIGDHIPTDVLPNEVTSESLLFVPSEAELNKHNDFVLESTPELSNVLGGRGNGSSLDKRQYQCSQWTSSTFRDTLECGDGTCSVGRTLTHTYSFGWSASASAAGWITGGFSVQQSVSSGNAYTRDGGPGESVCLWKHIGHTAYTVQNQDCNSCTGCQSRGGEYVMTSPNSNNIGTDFYCVRGNACRLRGSHYWQYGIRAGGA